MPDLADDTPTAPSIRKSPDLYEFRPLSGEEYAAEARTAARQGYVLAEARGHKAINFRWLLWAKEPLSTLDVILAFHAWKKCWHDASPPQSRVVSINGPWAKRRPGRIPLEARELSMVATPFASAVMISPGCGSRRSTPPMSPSQNVSVDHGVASHAQGPERTLSVGTETEG